MSRIPTPVILFLGLTIATCFIAYWSDNLGKKLGKKRISIFGLRPRQTATLITMGSSVGIMLLTLLVLMLSFQNFKDAVLRYDRVNDNNKRVRAENTQLQTLKAQLESQRDQLQGQVRESQRRVQQANASAKQARAQLKQVEVRLADLRGKLSVAQTSLNTARRGESSAKASAAQAQGRLNAAQTRLAAAQTRLGSAQTRLAAAQTRLGSAQSRLNAAQSRLNQTTSTLEGVNLNLKGARTSLARTRADLAMAKSRLLTASRQLLGTNKQILSQHKNILALEERAEKQQAEVDKLEQQRNTLENEINNQEKTLIKYTDELRRSAASVALLANQEIAVSGGQVLAAVTVPQDADARQARATLRNLVEQAAEAATKLGAEPFEENGVTRALHVVSPPTAPDMSEEETLTHFANYLTTNFDVPVSVRIVAARSYARGEIEMHGHLLAVPVRRAYAAGEIVITATIPSGQSDATVFGELIRLMNAAEAAARGRGVSPLLSETNPLFFATGTNERIFDALRVIQARRGAVTVRLVAASDLTTVEPMNVRFEVVSGEPLVLEPLGRNSS